MSEVADKTWWVYLLGCEDGRTYGGVAIDVDERFKLHVNGKGAKFTRSNPPIAILGVQSFATKSEALKAEHALKKLNREQRLEWARTNPRKLTVLNRAASLSARRRREPKGKASRILRERP